MGPLYAQPSRLSHLSMLILCFFGLPSLMRCTIVI